MMHRTDFIVEGIDRNQNQDPRCGITYAVCQCEDGVFYEYNDASKGCDPPWGVLANSTRHLDGFTCW
ncbi:hypothetical protein D6D01_10351 [Aureobasidium pullulans]|uniref:Uncharacterized protein n=1 Tax=Aureobasidium pullulans TaxID=5580 RepID=A0A4S9JG81_AURPU|nr:hypothetical protein D6D01_10351 [Aureobasidium pullulans]